MPSVPAAQAAAAMAAGKKTGEGRETLVLVLLERQILAAAAEVALSVTAAPES